MSMANESHVTEIPDCGKLTWKEFKDLCEGHGISDMDLLDDIDISWGASEFFKCEKDEEYGWKISLVAM